MFHLMVVSEGTRTCMFYNATMVHLPKLGCSCSPTLHCREGIVQDMLFRMGGVGHVSELTNTFMAGMNVCHVHIYNVLVA